MNTTDNGLSRGVRDDTGAWAARAFAWLAVFVGLLLSAAPASAGQLAVPTWQLQNGLRRSVPARSVAAADFVGQWTNANRATAGVSRLVITRSGGTYRLHAWGRCHPRDCDWGSATAAAFGSSPGSHRPVLLSAAFKQRTGETTVLVSRQGQQLIAQVLTRFSPAQARGRANFTATYRFANAGPAPSASTASAASAPVASSGTSGGSSAKQGRFRVVITGFSVKRETSDDALQRDGKGDEVYLLTGVATLGPDGKRRGDTKLRTRIMGDTNGWSGRLPAGSRSSRGGLQTGDQYPGPNPWRYSGRTYSDRLPELVWQGTLRQGGDSVLITPSIWEWDRSGNDLVSQVGLFLTSVPDLLFHFTDDASNWLFGGSGGSGGSYQGCLTTKQKLDSQILGVAETRPIGMKLLGDRYRFCPVSIALDYDKAMRVISASQGFGNGVVALDYQDASGVGGLGGGDYRLYIKVSSY